VRTRRHKDPARRHARTPRPSIRTKSPRLALDLIQQPGSQLRAASYNQTDRSGRDTADDRLQHEPLVRPREPPVAFAIVRREMVQKQKESCGEPPARSRVGFWWPVWSRSRRASQFAAYAA
jgi:hypothetical protein